MRLALLVLVMLSNWAQINAAQNVPTFYIPSMNGFTQDYGVKSPGDVLQLTVAPDTGVTIETAVVDNGSSAGWIGGPVYTATIPANFAGVHTGLFSGTYSRVVNVANNGGGGANALPKWNGTAKALVVIFHSATIRHSFDGTPDTRLTIGDCEKVKLFTDPPTTVTWAATSGAPLTASSDNFIWTAPEDPGTYVVTGTSGTATATFSFVVIDPVIRGQVIAQVPTPAGAQGVAMVQLIFFDPQSVNFSYCAWKEIGGGPSSPSGYFLTHPQPPHTPNPNWLAIESPGHPLTDLEGFGGFPSPWSAGSFEYVIPNYIHSIENGGNGHEFEKATQVMTIQDASGTSTVSKYGNTSAARTP